MKKVIVLAILVAFLMPLAAMPAFAADKTADVGNRFCPISGDPVSGTSFVEYQGKKYGLCCPACKSMFLADPAKAISKMKMQEAAAATLAPSEDAASREMEKGMEQGGL